MSGESRGSAGPGDAELTLQESVIPDHLSWKTWKTTITFLSPGSINTWRTEEATIPRVPLFSQLSRIPILSRFT